MKTDFNFLFTEKAQEALVQKGKKGISFPTPANMPVFLPGDLITFEQLDQQMMFKVRSRYFIWKTQEYLIIQYVLSLPTESRSSRRDAADMHEKPLPISAESLPTVTPSPEQ